MMFELRWLVDNGEKVLQYRYKYQTVVYPYSGGALHSNERVELVWSEWTPVREIEETNNAT